MQEILQKLFPTLGRKMSAAVALPLLVVGGLFLYFAHKADFEMLQEHAHAKAHGVAEFGRAILEHAMLEGENSHLQEALQAALSAHQVSDIYVLRSDSSIALSARGDPSVDRLPLERFHKTDEWPGEEFLSAEQEGGSYEYIVIPIIKKAECYKCHVEPEPRKGFLAAKISVEDVQAVESQHRTLNIVMIVVAFAAIGSVIFLGIHVLVVRPVAKLREQIVKVQAELTRIELGDQVHLPLLAPPQSRDEIASLSSAFNRLVQCFNEAQAKLQEMHQSQLQQAKQLATTGEMAASIAHEIKNPLAGVLGALQVFDAEIPADDRRKEIVREMMTQLKRANDAVNDLLNYARPTPPVFEEINLNGLVKRSLLLLPPLFNGKKVTVTALLQDGTPTIMADQKLLQQVLWNVLLNAIEAIDSAGTITIRTVWFDGSVKIEVEDTGEGMTEDRRAKLFKPFFTTKYKGTGLGLAVCKRVVDQHHGTISIKSEIGKGTTVTISLPISHNI